MEGRFSRWFAQGMLQQLAAGIVRCYPAPWRERYEAEVLSLVEDSHVRLIDLAEFGRGLIVERAKSLVEPGDSPRLSGFVYRPMAFGVRIAPSLSLVVGAAVLGEVARATLGKASEVASWVGVLLMYVILALYFRRRWTTRLQRAATDRIYPFFSRGERIALLSAVFVALFLFYWIEPPRTGAFLQFHRWFQLWGWIAFAGALTSGFSPWRAMLDALDEYHSASDELRWAQMEVDRCRALVDAGERVQQELNNAEIARDRLGRKRDAALAVVHTFGYRARFGQPS